MEETRMWPRVSIVTVVALVFALTAAAALATVQQPARDNTVTRIEVAEDGSARWFVQIRTRLATNESVTDYERFQEEFRTNRSTFLDSFRTSMRSIVASAGNDTRREMTARNFTASTSIQQVPRRWGVVTYEFTWTAFARQDGQDLVVGDAFEDGLYIERNDTLQIAPPEGHAIQSTDPAADKSSGDLATWRGRRDFSTDQPHVRMAPADGVGGTALFGLGLIPLLGVAVLVTIVGAFVTTRLYGDGATSAPGGSKPVSDRAKVRTLIERNGGRMKQSDVVDEFDWSKSKVSRLIGKLEDDGEVQKTRVGRENVVELVDS